MIVNDSAAAIEEFQNNLNVEFHKAVAKNNLDEMNKLLDDGADVNSLNHENESALFVAIDKNFIKIYTHLLLLRKIEINLTEAQAMILQKLTCRKYNLNAFILLQLSKIDIHSADEEGATILHYCAEYNSHRICKYLLDRNHPVDINKKTDNHGKTALHIACSKSYFNMVELLCDRPETDLDATDRQGRTPLYYTCNRNENYTIVEYLIEIGADINLVNENNNSPLMRAVTWKAYKIVRLLMS